MAITLQTVLPNKVLPRAPSPNSASPNPGIRASITHFIPASPDASLDQDAFAAHTGPADAPSASNAPESNHAHTRTRSRGLSTSSNAQSDLIDAVGLRSPVSPAVGRKSMSAGAGSRRGIAHSSRVLGVDPNADAYFDMTPLTNGKVDVSFEASLRARSPPPSNGKGKHRAHDADRIDNTEAVALFDVDLEGGRLDASSSHSRTTRLLQSMPWKKSKPPPPPDVLDAGGPPPRSPRSPHDSFDIPRHQRASTKADDESAAAAEDDDGGYDDDRQQLLHAGAAEERPGFFAPGDRSFGYSSLHGGPALGGYGGRVGFEPLMWRERTWMAASAGLVAALVVVAILISVDVIDWPGDGIGAN